MSDQEKINNEENKKNKNFNQKEIITDSTKKNLEKNKKVSPIEPILQVVNDNNIPIEKENEIGNDNEIFEKFEKAAFIIASLITLSNNKIKEKFSETLNSLKEFFQVGDSNNEDIDTNINVDKNKQETNNKTTASKKIETDIIRSRIVKQAKQKIGDTNFRSEKVDGGNLACAQVVSRILKESGVLDSEELSITQTISQLEKKKWKHKDANYNPKPGDIIIWKRTVKNIDDKHVQLGHKHIGVVIGEDKAISNSSIKKMPRLHSMGRIKDNYWKKRGIEGYMTPPSIQV